VTPGLVCKDPSRFCYGLGGGSAALRSASLKGQAWLRRGSTDAHPSLIGAALDNLIGAAPDNLSRLAQTDHLGG
jgi:hypothetical protein